MRNAGDEVSWGIQRSIGPEGGADGKGKNRTDERGDYNG